MLKLFISTFTVIFLAELGDKTQIATILLSAQSSSKLLVFIGSASALVASSLCCSILGGVINKYISAHLIQSAAGIAFIVIGILLLLNKI